MNKQEYQTKYKKELEKIGLVNYFKIATTKDKYYLEKFKAVEQLDFYHLGQITYAIFYNPDTKDIKSIWETDWTQEGLKNEDFENQDVKAIYGGDYVQEVWEDYEKQCIIKIAEWEEKKAKEEKAKRLKWGIVAEGDVVEIVKGRKIPLGEIKTVKEFFNYSKNGVFCCKYAIFTDGTKTNINNCKLIKQA